MTGFFKPKPTTASEAFLNGFKYLKEDDTRDSSFFYKMFSHNEELAEFILNKAKQTKELAQKLANNENAIADFIRGIDTIAYEVYAERTRLGKTYLKNIQKQSIDKDEALYLPTMLADVYRETYKKNQFEKNLISGLRELRNFIARQFGSDSLQIVNCDGCIETIKNYQVQKECIAYNHPFYQNNIVKEKAAELGKEYPVSHPTFTSKRPA